jgi:alginate production protein
MKKQGMKTLGTNHLALLFAGVLLAPPAALAVDADWNVKVKAAGFDEDAHDLGTTGAQATQAGYIDLQPQLYTHFSEDFAHFVRVQGFLPSEQVVTSEGQNQNEPVVTSGFAALREFWIEYGGITSYPGEVVRLGMQRVREPDGLWWDKDIESARWIFDTTLFQFQLGGAKAFNAYRTDNVELPQSERDKAYAFIGWSTQWVPGNYIGMRGAYATDQRELPASGAALEPQLDASGQQQTDPVTGDPLWTQPSRRDLGWLGLFLDNHFYEWDHGPGLIYRLEGIAMGGTSERSVSDASGHVTGMQQEDVLAFGGEGQLRARFPDPFPVQIGGGYAYGEGGHDKNGDHDFRQTGLQSNRSRFTGTRTIINRFNEAYQANLTNLRVASAFISLPLQDWDFSVVGEQFQRDDTTRRVSTDGVLVQPDPASTSHDLGTGWDFVLTRLFNSSVRGYSLASDDRRSNIRLRASQFHPGEAYGSTLSDQTRVTLEGTLWF